MMPVLSLGSRTFLLSFVSLCLALTASFFAINAAIKSKIKEELIESFHRSEAVLDKVDANYNRRTSQLISILSENPGLKAGIGLLQEFPLNHQARTQIRKTIEEQLRELGNALDYDLLVVSDANGQPIAAVGGEKNGIASPDFTQTGSIGSPLITVGGRLYEGTTVPINLQAENMGSLTIGKKLDLGSLNHVGQAALVRNHKVLLTTFSGQMVRDLEYQLQTRCPKATDGCEMKVAGETYLILPMKRANFGETYQLFSFQSIDVAMKQFTRGFERLFLGIGAGGVLISLLFSGIASRSVSKPLAVLIAHLRDSERTGRLPSDFYTNSQAQEVNLLIEAFNRAAAAVRGSQERLQQVYVEFIETMAQALDARDPYTAGHSNRVSEYSTAIATAMELPDDQIEIIRIGAQLHDIGKIGIPDAVLQKPGRLTDEEFGLIKLHPQIGKRILERVGQFQKFLPIVELHHENHGGRGYPYGLRGDEIPMDARIVHVADAYDAMTTDRAYRKAFDLDRVLGELERCAGTQFDPRVVDAFLWVLQQRGVVREASLAIA